jgi:hypothetical protein
MNNQTKIKKYIKKDKLLLSKQINYQKQKSKSWLINFG